MSAAALLAAVETIGGQIELVDDRLRLSAPLGTVPPELLAEVRAHRAEVIDFLRGVPDAAFREQELRFLERAAELERFGFDRDSAERCALAEVIAQSASPPRSWQEELRIVEEDLADEGTSFARVEREMRAGLPVPPRKKPLTLEEERWRRWRLGYGEVYPLPGCPEAPCACGERVFYRFTRSAPWRCRTCVRPDNRLRIDRWYVVPASYDQTPGFTPPHREDPPLPVWRCGTTGSRS